MISANADRECVRLADGRQLGWAEYGDARGRPVVWFPGTPGSRLSRPGSADGAETTALGVRLLVIERPGFGRSDFQPRRRVVDWPADFAAWLDALGLPRVAIAGPSGALPYLLACAHALPARVDRAALIGCVGPLDAAGLRDLPVWRRATIAAARHAPRLLERMLHRDPERLYRMLTRDVPPADRALLDAPGAWARQVDGTAEAVRAGLRGLAHELHLHATPWWNDVPLAAIDVPIDLWHGELDAAAPIATARRLAATLPRCRAHFLPGEGHFIFLSRWRDILTGLLA